MPEFTMPSLGADMDAGTLTRWYVKPGDRIKRGDAIAVVETDKADVDVESFDEGVVERLLVQPGQRVPVGTPLAFIGANGEAAPAEQRVRASPAARKLARELHVDLTGITGSGPHGVIELRDVHGIPAPAPPSVRAPVPAAVGVRRAIALAMSKANREIPHYYVNAPIEMERALTYLSAHNAALPVEQRVLPAALLLKASAVALTRVPVLNGYWIDDAPQRKESIHLGIAISLRQGGLVIPAIHDADAKTLDELMSDLRELIPRARAGRLKSSELTDATITVTNLGDLGVESVYGVIYPPQIALIGFGRIGERPVAHDGMLAARRVVVATLAGDHRASDGHDGARFLTELHNALQAPEAL